MVDSASFLAEVIGSHRAFDRARQLYSAEVAPEFNAISLLQPSELDLSRALAWMLDPSESHCQGAAFLFSFLDIFKIDRAGLGAHDIIVRKEEYIGENGRLDISIRLGKTRVVAIENKPFAPDQKQQLARYLDHIGDSGHVIYLPGEPREPSEYSISTNARVASQRTGRLIESSWVSLLPYFEHCRTLSKAPRVTHFLEELPRYIAKQFQGIEDMTETLNLVSQMTGSADAIEASFLVSNSLEVAKKQMLRKLGDDLSGRLPQGWLLVNEFNDPKGKALYIEYPRAKLYFYAAFENNRYGSFNYGLGWLESAKKMKPSEVQKVLEEFPLKANSTLPDYPWWKWADDEDGLDLPRDWGVDHRPWQRILDGTTSLSLWNAAVLLQPLAEALSSR